MGRSVFETVLGAFVLLIAALFISFAYKSADLQVVKGYEVYANFPLVDGLKEGIDVKINGVKIGTVSGIKLITTPGPNQYLVKVSMMVNQDIRLPSDTMALVTSEGLLGGKYMSLEPGVDDDMIKSDGTGRITRTQAPVRFDDLIGQLIYSSKKGSGDSAGKDAKPTTAAAQPEHP